MCTSLISYAIHLYWQYWQQFLIHQFNLRRLTSVASTCCLHFHLPDLPPCACFCTVWLPSTQRQSMVWRSTGIPSVSSCGLLRICEVSRIKSGWTGSWDRIHAVFHVCWTSHAATQLSRGCCCRVVWSVNYTRPGRTGRSRRSTCTRAHVRCSFTSAWFQTRMIVT